LTCPINGIIYKFSDQTARKALVSIRYSLYIIPHPDDGIFFAASQLQKDLLGKNRVILIYVTAGDAGQDESWWKAREQGALAALGNALCTSHFLRLPDGMEQGNGSARYGEQSLTRLRKSNRPIQSVDGAAIYRSWKQFCCKLEEIIRSETHDRDPDTVLIHAPEYDPLRNPDDHPDHVAVSDAIRTIAEGRYPASWWISYWSVYCPPNLSEIEIQWKRDRFLAYSKAIEKLTGELPNEKEWECWGNRGHFRTISRGGAELKSYDPRCPRRQQFSEIFNADPSALYERSWASVEEADHRARNLFTGNSASLSDAGRIAWQRLKKPTSVAELAQILSGSNPKRWTVYNALHFLNALLKMKLVYKI
jgi:hypothetical protein